MKLITKIVGATLGLAMAVGVGVGVANNSKKATLLDAAEGDTLYTATFTNLTAYSYTTNKSLTISNNNISGSFTISSSQENSNVFYLGCNTTSPNPNRGILAGTADSENPSYNNNNTWTDIVAGIRAESSRYNSNYSSDHVYAMMMNNAFDTVGNITISWSGGGNNASLYLFAFYNSQWNLIKKEDSVTFGTSTAGSWTYTNNDIGGLSFSKLCFAVRPGASATTNATSKTYKITTWVIKEGKPAADPSKTIQANSVTIKSGSNTISGTYEPSAPYYIGQTLDLTSSTVAYEQGATYQDGAGAINWTSSATGVATVSDGVVTFVSAGTTTITATAVDKGADNATVSASFTLDISNATYAPGTQNNPYTVAGALAASPANGVYVTGKISTITEVSLSNKNATYKISDDGTQNNEMVVYRGKYTGNTNFTAEHQIQLGDTVTVTGNLSVYSNANQLAAGNYITSLTPVQYSITYNANGADSGIVPVDSNSYSRNVATGVASITTKTNSGNLQKAGYVFNGWNTKADPTAQGAVHYNANTTIDISSSLVLYVEWLSTAPSITVTANLEGYTGEVIDLDFTYGNIANAAAISVVAADAKVTVGDIIAENNEGIVELTLNTAGETSLSFRNNGDELATCSVSITQSAATITGLPASDIIAVGDTLNLKNKITVTAVGTVSNSVTWVSDNTDVATVSSQGVVTAVSVGSANITVTADDYPSATMSCRVDVTLGVTFNLAADSAAEKSEEMVVWGSESIGFLLSKGSSSTAANNYLGGGDNKHTRVYKDQIIVIGVNPTVYKLVEAVFTATSSDYATTFANSSITNGSSSKSGSVVTLTPDNGAENLIVNIGGATRFTSVKLFYVNASVKQQVEYGAKTSSSLTYNYVKNGENDFTITDVKVRFGGYVTKALWNALNAESAIQGYGLMISAADEDPAGYIGSGTFKAEYATKLADAGGDIDAAISALCDNTKVFNFYKSGTPYLHEAANEVNYAEDTYAWNLVQNINSNHLTRTYVAVAYIRTNEGLVLLKEERISAADIAARMVGSGDYDESPLYESLNYLADQLQ